jgi:hypothetical protein
MDAAVIFLLDPSLSGAVEQLERELCLALEHGHESAFDDGPERFLFAVLLGTLRQGGVLQDRQPLEPLTCLGGEHRGAVVAEHGARKPSFLEGLTQAMHQ